MTIPDYLHETASQFVTAASLIQLDRDGIPNNVDQGLDCVVMTRLADRLHSQLTPDPGDDDAAKLYRMADAWMFMVEASRGGVRWPDAGARWLHARADAPDLLGEHSPRFVGRAPLEECHDPEQIAEVEKIIADSRADERYDL